MSKLTIQGFGHLEKAFDKLQNPRQVQKVVRQGINFALTPVVKVARANAPRGNEPHKLPSGRVVAPGYVSRHVKKVTVKGKNNDTFLIRGMVGVSKSAWYGLLYESGFERDDGYSVQGNEWLTKAGQQQQLMIARFNQKLIKALKKAAK